MPVDLDGAGNMGRRRRARRPRRIRRSPGPARFHVCRQPVGRSRAGRDGRSRQGARVCGSGTSSSSTAGDLAQSGYCCLCASRPYFLPSGDGQPASLHERRKATAGSPITFDGLPCTPSMNQPPRPSRVNPPATRSDSHWPGKSLQIGGRRCSEIALRGYCCFSSTVHGLVVLQPITPWPV